MKDEAGFDSSGGSKASDGLAPRYLTWRDSGLIHVQENPASLYGASYKGWYC